MQVASLEIIFLMLTTETLAGAESGVGHTGRRWKEEGNPFQSLSRMILCW